MRQKLILVRGIPGSGKSTYAKRLGIPDHYEADMWFDDNGGYDQSKIKLAHEWCFEMASAAMNAGRPVVVSNTFIRRWEMQRYIDHAESIGVPVEEVTMTGDYGSIHNVPDGTIERMRQSFEP